MELSRTKAYKGVREQMKLEETLKDYLDKAISDTNECLIYQIEKGDDVSKDLHYLEILRHIKDICVKRNKH